MKTPSQIENSFFAAYSEPHSKPASHLHATLWFWLMQLLTGLLSLTRRAGTQPGTQHRMASAQTADNQRDIVIDLQAENAKLKRLYEFAITELHALDQNPAADDSNALQQYVADRLRARSKEFAARTAELEHLAHTDHLTGLPNRRAFSQAAQRELARIRRNGQSACLLLGDIDYFKSFNDRFGHVAGDLVLQTVATCLRDSIRAADTVARWGGEEFVLLLPETELLGAQRAAEKCRLAVQSCALAGGGNEVNGVTMTFGISLISPDESIEAAIARADSALYAGKHEGRNRVVVGL